MKGVGREHAPQYAAVLQRAMAHDVSAWGAALISEKLPAADTPMAIMSHVTADCGRLR